MPFPKHISPKINIILWLEFELAYFTGFRSKIWNNCENVFFSLISLILEKKNLINLNFHLALSLKHFFKIKIQPKMSEQEKKWQRIYNLLNTKTKSKFLGQPYTKQKIFFTEKKNFLRKSGSGGLNKK